MSRVLYIRNPAAHGGSVPGVWDRFLTQWMDKVDPDDVLMTRYPGHAREVAASINGYDIIAAVGGDGTANEIICGIMERQEPRPRLATIPGGTGNDIARNVGVRSIEDSVAALRENNIRAFDVVRVDCILDGESVHRYAFLDCSVGFSGIPMVKPWMKRWLGPKGAYYLGTLIEVMKYRAPTMKVIWNDEEQQTARTLMVIIGNVERSAGGSMCIAPGARADDGELNVTIMPSVPRPRMIRLMPKIPTGDHIHQPGVRYFTAKRIEVTSDPSSIIEVDGDLFGTTPATFTVYPGALEVITPI